MRRARGTCALCAGLALSLTAPVSLAGSVLAIRAIPDHVTLNGDGPQEVALEIDVPEASARYGVAALRVETSAGAVKELRRVGPTRFFAKLEPPAEAFPQVAVVSVADIALATAERAPEVAVAVVAFSARIELKGKSEPRVSMRLDVGGARFGPVQADDAGGFVLPVVVPPGEGWATGLATDSLGNSSRSKINLFLPAVQRLHAYAFPEALVADGADRGFVFVTTVSPVGAPQGAAVDARAAHGVVEKIERLASGLTRIAYRAPAHLGEGWDEVTIEARSGGAQTNLRIPLVAGAPSSMKVTASPSPAPADGATPTTISVALTDANGNRASGHLVRLTSEEMTLGAREIAPGQYAITVPPRAQAGVRRAKIELVPLAASCLRAWSRLVPAGLELRDSRGLPCAGTAVPRDVAGNEAARVAVAFDGVVPQARGADAMLTLVEASGLERPVRVLDRAELTAPTPLSAAAELRWRVPTPVELALVLIERRGAEARLRLSARGVDDVAARVALSATGGRIEIVSQRGGDTSLRLSGASGVVDVVATDKVTGVSAWLRVE